MITLVLNEDKRIEYITYPKYKPSESVAESIDLNREDLPEGRIIDYKYVNGEFVFDPIVNEITENVPSQLDLIEAQVTYTAMMTGTLLEVK